MFGLVTSSPLDLECHHGAGCEDSVSPFYSLVPEMKECRYICSAGKLEVPVGVASGTGCDWAVGMLTTCVDGKGFSTSSPVLQSYSAIAVIIWKVLLVDL